MSECNFPVLRSLHKIRCNGTQKNVTFLFFVVIQLLAAGMESDEWPAGLMLDASHRCWLLCALVTGNLSYYRRLLSQVNVGTANVTVQ